MAYVNALARGARRVLTAQAVATLAFAVGFGVASGWPAAAAASYGGAITITVTAWLAWRLRRVRAQATPGTGAAVIYSSALLRYLALIALIAMGFALLKLMPLPLLLTFAVTQFGFLAGLLPDTGRGRSRP
jgi:ATP synthase protein I